MIPKIIHYVWLSGNKIPRKIEYCINSWKRELPDYQLMLWDLNKFDISKSRWVEQCYINKKYAFATDYIRLFSLYNYGGIYLDSDVEVLKSFNNLLSLPYFFGKENSEFQIEPAIIGAEKKCQWIKECLDYYENRNFIDSNGNLSMRSLPSIMTEILLKKYTIREIKEIKDFNCADHEILRFPAEYFSPLKWNGKGMQITQNTYTIHHFSGSWNTPYQMIKIKIRKMFNLTDNNIIIKIYKKIKMSQ